jgi:TonB family protein
MDRRGSRPSPGDSKGYGGRSDDGSEAQENLTITAWGHSPTDYTRCSLFQRQPSLFLAGRIDIAGACQQNGPATNLNMRSLVNFRRLALILTLLIMPGSVLSTENFENRTSTAKHMAKEFSSLGIHAVYVPDFCDGPSRPNARGAFFAATFSEMLSKKAKGFAVVSRKDAHRFLQQNNLTDCDIIRPEILAKFSPEFSVDCILSTNLSFDKDSYSMDFVLRDLSGKELYHSHYSEPHDAGTEAMFPATASSSGWPFYFSALDGVSMPKGVYMPNPPYPGPFPGQRASGVIIISALVTIDGKINEIRVVQSLSPEIDRTAIEKMKTWKFVPANAPDGTPVPVRAPFNLFFSATRN